MKSQPRSFALAVCIGIACGCGGGGGGGNSPTTVSRPPYAKAPTCRDDISTQSQRILVPGAHTANVVVPSSTIEQPSDAGCRVHTNHLISSKGMQSSQAAVSGLTPAMIANAYGAPNQLQGGAGAIAIVDCYNYPTALYDFDTFSSKFGLPTEPSNTVAASSNQVFQVVYETGQAPASNGSWSQEMAIDIEWSHAMAPRAKIYLVEAASTSYADIIKAVNVAKVLPGVREVSCSFGGSEVGCEYVDYDSAFSQPGVAFFAAAGDTAAGRQFPALSMNVVAVGGTTLTVDSEGNWLSEKVWSDTGCGPSAFEPRPLFQDAMYKTIGLYRAGCDIAADADPNTGVFVYDSFASDGYQGWIVFGGTSVACPVVAGIMNASGVTFPNSQALNKVLYSNAGSSCFHAISSGSAGSFNAGTPWCFPTGLGSPNNVGAFLAG